MLEVIHLVFNEGHAATDGPDRMRPGLCEQALRLDRVPAELASAMTRDERERTLLLERAVGAGS